MRNTARWAATSVLTATAVCGPLTGASLAPATAPAPTMGHGESAALATPVRAVTPTCAPTASGTHPDPVAACAELRGAGGNLDTLAARYAPLVVTVDGVWQGRRVSYERAFADECVRNAGSRSFLAF